MKENILRGIGITSINKLKTHCPNGHEYNKINTYIRKEGWRSCRICRKDSNKKSYLKKNRGDRN